MRWDEKWVAAVPKWSFCAFGEIVAPLLNAARTSQRDVPTNLREFTVV
jgi:hypothetical protein